MGTRYEKHYNEFRGYLMQGWKLETIAKHLGVTVGRLKSADYIARYRKEMGTAQVRKAKAHLIDTDRMYELIHVLESRYGKLTDEIPEDDRQLMKLRKVVHAN